MAPPLRISSSWDIAIPWLIASSTPDLVSSRQQIGAEAGRDVWREGVSFPQSLDAVLFLAVATSLRMFIRVLSDSCRQLHLVSDEYYFFIASKIGADCRVMGIATADETAPNKGRFFRLHRTIYTLGVFLIKA